MSHHRRALAVLLATVALLVWACLQLRQLAAGSWSAGLARAPWRQAAHDPAAVQSLAGALAASAALAICTWLLLGVLLSGVAALAPGQVGAAGARAARAVAPALIRNAVAALLGVAVVVPLAAPAVAAPGDQRRPVTSVSVTGTPVSVTGAPASLTGAGPVIRPLHGADPRWQAPAQPRPAAASTRAGCRPGPHPSTGHAGPPTRRCT